MQKLDVAIAGATGAVGQQLIVELATSQRFVVRQLLASSKNVGRLYGKCARPWMADHPLPSISAELSLQSLDDPIKSKIIFSALPSSVAQVYEPIWVAAGHWVFSLASTHRMERDTPMVVVDVNPEHCTRSLEAASQGKGTLICKPNCVVAILAAVLKPLLPLGLKGVNLVSLQSLSGAGYPGPSAWQMCGDLLGWIDGEEEKIQQELPKLLGSWVGEGVGFEPLPLAISASCMRVGVARGHTLQITLEMEPGCDEAAIAQALSRSNCLRHEADPLMLTPSRVIARAEPMAVYWGRLRRTGPSQFQVLAIGDNLGRGASRGALALADYFCSLL